MVPYGPVGSSLVPYGPVWSHMVPCGLIRSSVPGLNLAALNCCLTLKFGECIESYVQLAKIKKEIKKKVKTTEKLNFWNYSDQPLNYFKGNCNDDLKET